MTGLGAQGVLTAVVSAAQTLGVFSEVRDYEPRQAMPKDGVSLALWLGPVDPIKGGLSSTSARVVIEGRLYRSVLEKPYSDVTILNALDTFIGTLSADFTLGGRLRGIDLLGMYGTTLSGIAGYIEQDSKVYRIIDIQVPLMINDVWTQAP